MYRTEDEYVILQSVGFSGVEKSAMKMKKRTKGKGLNATTFYPMSPNVFVPFTSDPSQSSHFIERSDQYLYRRTTRRLQTSSYLKG